MSVFISHSRVNSSTALRLSDELRKRNVETWLDLRDLTSDKDWEREVSSAIQNADGFLLAFGPPVPATDGKPLNGSRSLRTNIIWTL